MPATTFPGQQYPAQYNPSGGYTPPTPTDGVHAEIAFGSPPGTEPGVAAWVDVTQWLTEVSVRRGRQKELDRVDAGSCTIKLINSDRRFDPTNNDGPYYPYVLPMRMLRVKYVISGVTYALFTGFVEEWPQTWPSGNTVAFATVSATDAFLPLSKADIGAGEDWPDEACSPRINRVLDEVGWPAGQRNIDNNYSIIAGETISPDAGITALQHLLEVADAELGLFFIDGYGRAVFHARHHRRATAYLTAAATFNDNGTGLPYMDLVPEYTVERIWNDVRVSVGSGFAQAEDTTSQTAYLRRTLTRSVPLARETEAEDQADYLLAQYKDPQYRLTSLTMKPTTSAQWLQAVSRELGDHIKVTRHPPPTGSDAIVQECFIESIEHRSTANPKEWVTTWLLSTPAFTAVDWWLLGDATYGVEGTTTKLVY